MNEGQFQQLVMHAIKTHGLLGFHVHDSRRSNPGFPDTVVVGGAGILFRELKTETGVASPMQTYWIEALRAAGEDAAIWRPSQWPDPIMCELKELGRMSVSPPQISQAALRKKLLGSRRK